jgi:CheY-like chemotaxis protein
MSLALIVDDSKTARYALRQLLDKQKFAVDMVESAEQALDYLRGAMPDLIFMDHMMPGMDGFEAVKAIKSNPATAAIPIVMYTSPQGGVYFGQARALGAADVIAKPASAEELRNVLRRLEQHALLPVPKPAAKPAPVELAAVGGPAPELEPESEPAPETGWREPPQSLSEEPPLRTAGAAGYWLAAALLLLALWLGVLYRSAQERSEQLGQQQVAAFRAVEWAVNQAQEYPYGELPFSGDRLQRLQELVVQLKAAGFRGAIRLESHVGQFCLVRGGKSGWRPPAPEVALTECGVLGQSPERSQQLSAGQSAAFKRFTGESPLLGDDIRIEIVARGASEPLLEYPGDAEVSAGEWNRIAQRNQRVHTVLLPRLEGGR